MKFRLLSSLLILCFIFVGTPVKSVFGVDQASLPDYSDSEETFSNFAQPASDYPAASRGASASTITLELKGVNVLDVLKILSKRSGLNIVAGRDVKGDVTLYLQDVEVRKALDTVVQTLGLAYEERDGIITVMSSKEYESKYGKSFRDERETRTFKFKYANPQAMNTVLQTMKSSAGKIALDERTSTVIVTDMPAVLDEIQEAIKSFDEPLVTKVFTLQFSKVADLETQLKDFLTATTGLLKIDKRTNQVSITDRRENVEQVEKVIKAFDVRPLQVLIDAKVVEVQLYDAYRFGVNWNYVASKLGDAKQLNAAPNFSVSAPSSTLGGGSLSTLAIGEDASDDNPTSFDTVISILQNIGKTNILSSPRLLVLNNEEAKLAVATRQPFVSQTVSQSQSTSTTADQVQFIDVGVTLSVVPTISEDHSVILKVKPEVSTAGDPLQLQGAASGSDTTFVRTVVPVVTTQTLETTVVIKDKTTVVIGGLMQDRHSKTRKKIPVLGDIPWVGAAFRSEANDFNKTELVIFLTPRIIDGQSKAMERDRYLDNKGEWIDFDRVGGYDFQKAQSHTSQGPFMLNDQPYWESPVKEKPVYIAPKNSAIAALPHRNNVNDFMERTPAGDEILPVSHRAREYYRGMIHAAIAQALNQRKEFQRLNAKFELFLIVSKNGDVQLNQVTSDTGLSERAAHAISETVKSLSPFPPFSKDMDSDQELLDLKFEVS